MQEWISIDERLPEVSEYVIGATPIDDEVWHIQSGRFSFRLNSGIPIIEVGWGWHWISHWMPLPEPPTNTQQKTRPVGECNCEEWKIGWKQIVAAQVFCANQAAGPKYMGPVIEFCPWCGEHLPMPDSDEKEERRKARRSAGAVAARRTLYMYGL